MKTLLEKAIVHLLNGDDDKAAALFHKFMVERARQIHEALRENDNSEDSLDENWDHEIQEEEYFGDDDLGDDTATMDGDAPPVGDEGGDEFAGDADMGGDQPMDDASADGMGDEGMGDDLDGQDGMGEGDPEGGLEGKIDDLTDKIDELTAEFDRVMATFHDDDDGMGDDMGDGSDDGFDSDTTDDAPDFGGDVDTADDTEGSDDLADRMGDDMGDESDDDDHAPVAEGELPDFLKKKNKDKDEDGDKDKIDEEDDEGETDETDEDPDALNEITESVLAELDKIAPPGNSEYKGVGQGSVKNNITSGAKDSPLPKHNVMDRMGGEPVMTKGPTHKGYARETAPSVDGAEKLVQNVRTPNRRKSFKDTMSTVPADGDGSALLNKDFAPGMPKATKSITAGKSTKG